jgi:hypothetical protein
MNQSEYMRLISDKLDRLKKASGENTSHPISSLDHRNSLDPFKDMGDSAVAYLKKIGKWPINGNQSL